VAAILAASPGTDVLEVGCCTGMERPAIVWEWCRRLARASGCLLSPVVRAARVAAGQGHEPGDDGHLIKPVAPRATAVHAAVMTSRISHTTFDAVDAYAQSVFWARVLGFAENPEDPNLPGHEECPIFSADGSEILLFISVPDGAKEVKNRLHLDLKPIDRTREEEAERLVALGASQVADHRRPGGTGWITMADPEGNEFCILPRNLPAFSPSE
jgi:catechol 2,3-dioxygenase-like lactoylglutathione lyase family enzyme